MLPSAGVGTTVGTDSRAGATDAGVDGTLTVGNSACVGTGLRDGTSAMGEVGISVISPVVGPDATGETKGDVVNPEGTLVIGSLDDG